MNEIKNHGESVLKQAACDAKQDYAPKGTFPQTKPTKAEIAAYNRNNK